MNLGQAIENFNLLSQTLFSELAFITNDRGVQSLLIKSKLAVKIKQEILITQFIEKFYKYRDLIHGKDYIHFDNNVHVVQDAKFNNDLAILFCVWDKLSDSNKQVMFSYLTQLLICCDIYMSIIVGCDRLEYGEQYANDGDQQYANDGDQQYANDGSEQYANDGDQQYANDGGEQYANDGDQQYVNDGDQQYTDSGEQYASERDSNGVDSTENDEHTYENDEQSANDAEQYSNDAEQSANDAEHYSNGIEDPMHDTEYACKYDEDVAPVDDTDFTDCHNEFEAEIVEQPNNCV
jgi:hypothetical protein